MHLANHFSRRYRPVLFSSWRTVTSFKNKQNAQLFIAIYVRVDYSGLLSFDSFLAHRRSGSVQFSDLKQNFSRDFHVRCVPRIFDRLRIFTLVVATEFDSMKFQVTVILYFQN